MNITGQDTKTTVSVNSRYQVLLPLFQMRFLYELKWSQKRDVPTLPENRYQTTERNNNFLLFITEILQRNSLHLTSQAFDYAHRDVFMDPSMILTERENEIENLKFKCQNVELVFKRTPLSLMFLIP